MTERTGRWLDWSWRALLAVYAFGALLLEVNIFVEWFGFTNDMMLVLKGYFLLGILLNVEKIIGRMPGR